MKNSRVSIIVPVYNVETFLPRCIDTLLGQTHPNIEILLVNDGSTDGSTDICDSAAFKDSRVRVIHKENSGSSDSRNMGLDAASGDFIMFVDSDDYIHERAVEVLLSAFNRYENIDVSTAGYVSVSELTQDVLWKKDLRIDKNGFRVRGTEGALEEMMYQNTITNAPWSKIYRSSVIGDIRYQSGMINQDLGTTYRIFARARGVATTSLGLYFYTYRPGSVINSKFSPRRMAGLRFANEQLQFISEVHPSIEGAAIDRLFAESMFVIMSMRFADTRLYLSEYDAAVKIVMSTRLSVLKDKKTRRSYRLLAAVSYLSPKIFILAAAVNRHRTRMKRSKSGV